MKDDKYGALDTKGKIPKPCSFAKASNVIKALKCEVNKKSTEGIL